ncbi:endo-1,4-beta-xylanase [Streptomyces millisiae]|uniref:Beta-xylanase n=1 Tax=Streptomyces millisiae TaxID=3075542 RepID=A0ABU2LQU8_9ACTN|nr:endo-1,4-beta-xylanase [Streptomyces sp. DSM 44918]MDT0319880.1 endo-1,4-beta-xylanase [Streptomyces sp. DSM 44918]
MFHRVRGAAVAALAAAALLAPTGAANAADAAEDPGVAAPPLRDLAAESGRFFGLGISGPMLDQPRYTAIASTEFSSVTPGNEMKWGSVEPTRGNLDWTGADRIVDFAEEHDQEVHGHTLVWHSQLPNWVANGDFADGELRQVMTDHVTTQVGRYAGRIARWDVVNEPLNEDGTLRDTVFLREIGPGYIADALRAARAADPEARLYINDYNTDGVGAKSDGMYELVRSLLDQGVPLDGVGFQSHLILGQVPSSMRANLQRFADLGLEVAVTELDVRMQLPADAAKLEQQAADYGAVVGACVAVTRCTGVTIWGFTDADSWIPPTFPGQGAALPWDENYQPKPAYHAIVEALGGDPAPEPEPGACVADYRVTNRWNAGSTVDVRITTDRALAGWTVTFDLPVGESVVSSWNTSLTQNGTTVTARNAAWNGTVGAGGTLGFGFQTDSGAVYGAPVPALNGTVCTGAANT